MLKWNLAQDIGAANAVKVFSGGACNVLDANGKLLRNRERDDINNWLTNKKILLYDPQIHPDTHGYEYNYDIHAPLEAAARKAAEINLFEISPLTFGGVTSLEIAVEEFRQGHPTIIFFSDGNNSQDIIPKHSKDGYPEFDPNYDRNNLQSMKAHYQEMIKNANRMRQYLMRFAENLSALTVSFDESSYEGDIEIGPTRIHAREMFEAVTRAASGKRTNVNFTGGRNAQNEKGYPILVAPEDPREADLITAVDRYKDDGSELREAICNLVRVSVYVRVVYTQSTAIGALESLLQYKKILA